MKYPLNICPETRAEPLIFSTFVTKQSNMYFPWHLYVMASLYLLAGINHFRRPRLYLKIIPPIFPKPRALNAISGGAEIVLALLLCVPGASPYAAIGIIVLLIAVFPANWFMYRNENASLGLSKTLLWLRLPLQILLVVWAYQYVVFDK